MPRQQKLYNQDRRYSLSTHRQLKAEVPQESVLRPLLNENKRYIVRLQKNLKRPFSDAQLMQK